MLTYTHALTHTITHFHTHLRLPMCSAVLMGI